MPFRLNESEFERAKPERGQRDEKERDPNENDGKEGHGAEMIERKGKESGSSTLVREGRRYRGGGRRDMSRVATTL